MQACPSVGVAEKVTSPLPDTRRPVTNIAVIGNMKPCGAFIYAYMVRKEVDCDVGLRSREPGGFFNN